MFQIMFVVVVLGCVLQSCHVESLDNGLARTPPMGWLQWGRFGCRTDCKYDPHNCISENLLMHMAERLEEDGYKDVGYEYINVDDCYLAKERDSNGKLQPDPARFPHGMKFVADYIHSRGLKLGVYADYGKKTCSGFPGSQGYEKVDADTFAFDWEVDMLKLDDCNSNDTERALGYPLMGKYLNLTGRPILYSCSWSATFHNKSAVPYKEIAVMCNMWRTYNDININWISVLNVINFFGKNTGNFTQVAGPGHFNDPDMILAGNDGLTYEQQKTQLAMWSIMAAPLLMSNDLRNIKPETKALLQNTRVIAIDQDPLGIQGTIVRNETDERIQLWSRPITPVGSWAFCVINTRSDDAPYRISWTLKEMGLTFEDGYMITEVFEGTKLGLYLPDDEMTFHLDPKLGSFMGKAVPKLNYS